MFWDRLAVHKVDRQAIPPTVCGTAWRSTFWTARRSQNWDHEIMNFQDRPAVLKSGLNQVCKVIPDSRGEHFFTVVQMHSAEPGRSILSYT